MEMFISLSLSLLAVSAMLTLVANTLGHGTKTIKMSRLNQELRASMQLMSRDLRRSNFHGSFLQCFANTNCRADLGITGYINNIQINASGNCFWYWLDRNGDAVLTDDAVGGFRYSILNGVGVLQMRISGNSAANCDTSDGWELITNPGTVEITGFSISNSESYSEAISAAGDTQSIEKLRLIITGRMVDDLTVQRQIQNLIQVRNHVQTAGA